MIETQEDERDQEEEETPLDSGLTDQLRRVLKDAIDYLQSVLALLQAKTADLAMSAVAFMILIAAAGILALSAVLLLLVAAGIWLAHVTGQVGLAVLIMGAVAAVLAVALAWAPLRWLSKLRS